jgi:hypothetical protein
VEFLSLVSLKNLSITRCPKLIGPPEAKSVTSRGKDFFPATARNTTYIWVWKLDKARNTTYISGWAGSPVATDARRARGWRGFEPHVPHLPQWGCANRRLIKKNLYITALLLSSYGVRLTQRLRIYMWKWNKLMTSLPGGTGNYYSTLQELKITYCPALNMKQIYKCLHRYSKLEVKELSRAYLRLPSQGIFNFFYLFYCYISFLSYFCFSCLNRYILTYTLPHVLSDFYFHVLIFYTFA